MSTNLQIPPKFIKEKYYKNRRKYRRWPQAPIKVKNKKRSFNKYTQTKPPKIKESNKKQTQAKLITTIKTGVSY